MNDTEAVGVLQALYDSEINCSLTADWGRRLAGDDRQLSRRPPRGDDGVQRDRGGTMASRARARALSRHRLRQAQPALTALPPPNQIDDLHVILRLGVKAEAAATRGHELFAQGDVRKAAKALEEAQACMDERRQLFARWGVEDPAQPRRRR